MPSSEDGLARWMSEPMIGLDTNIILRYVMADDPVQSAVAQRIVESQLSDDQPGYLNDIVLCELVWTLRRAFKQSRHDVGRLLQKLFVTRQLSFRDPRVLSEALVMFRTTKADFADCLLAVRNLAEGCSVTISFDVDAQAVHGMTDAH